MFNGARAFNYMHQLDAAWNVSSAYPGDKMYLSTCSAEPGCGICGKRSAGISVEGIPQYHVMCYGNPSQYSQRRCQACRDDTLECCDCQEGTYRSGNECKTFVANDASILEAVQMWNEDPGLAGSRYGNISYWDIHKVSTLQNREFVWVFKAAHCIRLTIICFAFEVFADAVGFNADISKWNTSRVTSLSGSKSFVLYVNDRAAH